MLSTPPRLFVGIFGGSAAGVLQVAKLFVELVEAIFEGHADGHA